MLASCQPAGGSCGDAAHWLYLHQPAVHIKPFFGQSWSGIANTCYQIAASAKVAQNLAIVAITITS